MIEQNIELKFDLVIDTVIHDEFDVWFVLKIDVAMIHLGKDAAFDTEKSITRLITPLIPSSIVSLNWWPIMRK